MKTVGEGNQHEEGDSSPRQTELHTISSTEVDFEFSSSATAVTSRSTEIDGNPFGTQPDIGVSGNMFN